MDHNQISLAENVNQNDASTLLVCIIFIFFGLCGVFANGRSLCLFLTTHVVSIHRKCSMKKMCVQMIICYVVPITKMQIIQLSLFR